MKREKSKFYPRMETFHEGDVVIADAGEVLAVSVVAKGEKPGVLTEAMVVRLRARLSEWLLARGKRAK